MTQNKWPFVIYLFNAIIILEHNIIVLYDDNLINELDKVWKEVVMA